MQLDYKSNLLQRNQAVFYVFLCKEMWRLQQLFLSWSWLGICVSGLIKVKAVFIQHTEATLCNLWKHKYSTCVLVCITVSSVYASNQRENYKETSDSQKSSWRLEVTFTQRSVLMELKSRYVDETEIFKREMKFNSVWSYKHLLILGKAVWMSCKPSSLITCTHTLLKSDLLNTSAFTTWKSADTHHRMNAMANQTHAYKYTHSC